MQPITHLACQLLGAHVPLLHVHAPLGLALRNCLVAAQLHKYRNRRINRGVDKEQRRGVLTLELALCSGLVAAKLLKQRGRQGAVEGVRVEGANTCVYCGN